MANILNVELEVITRISEHLIHEVESFSSFSKFLMIWERSQPSHRIKFLLESLDWDRLYHYHHHHMEVTRDQFLGFVSYGVKHNADQAMFVNSTRNLLMSIDVQNNLSVLNYLSGIHFPSYFVFIFFKAIYRPAEIDNTADQMFVLKNNMLMRRNLEAIMKLVTDMYSHLFMMDYLLPPYKFCPNARNPIPFNRLDGFPLEEDMFNSLCTDVVQGKYSEDGSFFRQPLKKEHIWNSTCRKCSLQLIVFKILFDCME